MKRHLEDKISPAPGGQRSAGRQDSNATFGCTESEMGPALSTPSARPARDANETLRLRPGDRLGRYVVEKELGTGGMGVVYRARDENLQRSVAIKLLRNSGSAPPAARKRLLREARSMAKLSAHPNVITVYEADTIGERDYIAMELIDGTDVDTWLADNGESWQQVLAVFAEAGAGLAAAHAAGLVHRDFKPHNVLIARDGRVVVTDFGLALVGVEPGSAATGTTDNAVIETPLTKTGAILGTPAYMAPEQHRGETVDARADQYSFCAALYQGVYGTLPFRGSTASELRAAIAARRLASEPSKTRVPRRLRRILIRGLAREPDDRFASMDELLAEIRQVGRRPRRIAAASAVLVAAAAATAAIALGWPGATAETRPEAQPNAAAPRPLPDEPERRAAVESVRARLAEARAMQRRGELDGALETAQNAIVQARAIAYPALTAETQFRLGEAWRVRSRYIRAARAYREAERIARQIGDRETLAWAQVMLALVATSPDVLAPSELENRIRLAKIAVREHGGDPELSGYLAIAEAIQAFFQGDRDTALGILARARVALEQHAEWRMVAFARIAEIRFRLALGEKVAARAALAPLFAALSTQEDPLEYDLACTVELALTELGPEIASRADVASVMRRAERHCPKVYSSSSPTDTRAVAGRIVDSVGNPAAGARISIGQVLAGDSENALTGVAALSPALAQATSDDSGAFTASAVPAIARIIVAETARERSFPRVLDGDGDTRDVMLSLRPIGGLTGRVSRDNLHPRQLLAVLAVPTVPSIRLQAHLAVHVDVSGSYKLERLAAGTYRVILLAQVGQTFDELKTRFLAEHTDIEIQPGAVTELSFAHISMGEHSMHVLVRSPYQQALEAAHVIAMPRDQIPADIRSMDEARFAAPSGHRVGDAKPIVDSLLTELDSAQIDDLHADFTDLKAGPWVVCAITWARGDIMSSLDDVYIGYPEDRELECTQIDIRAQAAPHTVVLEAAPPRRR